MRSYVRNEAVKYFRFMIEVGQFVIGTDHKPITYAFQKKSSQCTPRQFRLLNFIGQFSTDIRHISGRSNVVADALSRVVAVGYTLDFAAVTTAQEPDEKLKSHIQGNCGLVLKKLAIPGTNAKTFCDISISNARPFLPPQFRRDAFEYISPFTTMR